MTDGLTLCGDIGLYQHALQKAMQQIITPEHGKSAMNDQLPGDVDFAAVKEQPENEELAVNDQPRGDIGVASLQEQADNSWHSEGLTGLGLMLSEELLEVILGEAD